MLTAYHLFYGVYNTKKTVLTSLFPLTTIVLPNLLSTSVSKVLTTKLRTFKAFCTPLDQVLDKKSYRCFRFVFLFMWYFRVHCACEKVQTTVQYDVHRWEHVQPRRIMPFTLKEMEGGQIPFLAQTWHPCFNFASARRGNIAAQQWSESTKTCFGEGLRPCLYAYRNWTLCLRATFWGIVGEELVSSLVLPDTSASIEFSAYSGDWSCFNIIEGTETNGDGMAYPLPVAKLLF